MKAAFLLVGAMSAAMAQAQSLGRQADHGPSRVETRGSEGRITDEGNAPDVNHLGCGGEPTPADFKAVNETQLAIQKISGLRGTSRFETELHKILDRRLPKMTFMARAMLAHLAFTQNVEYLAGSLQKDPEFHWAARDFEQAVETFSQHRHERLNPGVQYAADTQRLEEAAAKLAWLVNRSHLSSAKKNKFSEELLKKVVQGVVADGQNQIAMNHQMVDTAKVGLTASLSLASWVLLLENPLASGLLGKASLKLLATGTEKYFARSLATNIGAGVAIGGAYGGFREMNDASQNYPGVSFPCAMAQAVASGAMDRIFHDMIASATLRTSLGVGYAIIPKVTEGAGILASAAGRVFPAASKLAPTAAQTFAGLVKGWDLYAKYNLVKVGYETLSKDGPLALEMMSNLAAGRTDAALKALPQLTHDGVATSLSAWKTIALTGMWAKDSGIKVDPLKDALQRGRLTVAAPLRGSVSKTEYVTEGSYQSIAQMNAPKDPLRYIQPSKPTLSMAK
jgi:hypothetical protein